MPRGGRLESSASILAHVRSFLAEPAPARFSDDTLYRFIDLAAHEVGEDTGMVRSGTTLTWPAGQSVVNLGPPQEDYLAVISVHWHYENEPDRLWPIEVLSSERLRELLVGDGNVRTGLPRYLEIVESYTPPPHTFEIRLRIWPTPDNDGTLVFAYAALPWTPLVGDAATTVISVRKAFRDLVVIKALQYCYENLGRHDLMQFKQAQYDEMLRGVRVRLLDQTTDAYEELIDDHRFDYV